MNTTARRIITYFAAFIIGLVSGFMLSFMGVFVMAFYWGAKLEGDPSDKIDALTNSGEFAFCSTMALLAGVGIALALGFLIDRKMTLKAARKKK